MHPEFAMVFPSLLSYVRLSIRLVRIIFFPLLPLGAVTVPSTSLSENWHCFVIFNYHAREWVPPLLQTSILRLNHATQALIYSGCYQRKIFQHKNVTTVDEKNGIAFNGIVLW